MDQLLDCPFCGANAIERTHAIAVEVRCLGCGASVLAVDHKKALDLWNMRIYRHIPDVEGAMIVLHESPAPSYRARLSSDADSLSVPAKPRKRR